MNVDWDALWYNIFGVTHWHGIAMGFWVGMLIVALVVVGMNLVEWNVKKFDPEKHAQKELEKLHKQQEAQKRHDERRKAQEEKINKDLQ